MKFINIILLLLLSAMTVPLDGQAIVKPEDFPEKTTAEGTDFTPTRVGGNNRKIFFSAQKKYFTPNVVTVPVGYTPTATGNTLNLMEFVEDPLGNYWYIDSQGEAFKFSGGGGGLGDGDYGDISVTGSGTVMGIDPGTVGSAEILDNSVAMGDLAFTPLTAEADGSVTNEIQSIDTARLNGTVLELSLTDDGVARRAVDLSPVSGAPAIGALTRPIPSDSINLSTNAGTRGVTLAELTELAGVNDNGMARTNRENRLEKSLLQPAGRLRAENGRVSWNVRDIARATLDLDAGARLLPPVAAGAGGSYTLTVRQDGTGHPITMDGSVYHLDDTVSTVPWSVTTVHFTCPDGRNLYGKVSSKVPDALDVLLSDFQDDLNLAIVPSAVEGNWLEGLSQEPKHTPITALGSSFAVTKDRSRHALDIYHSTSPADPDHLWEVQREGGLLAIETDSANAWTIRGSRYLTAFHSGSFTFDTWVKRKVDGGYFPIIAVAAGSVGQNGLRLRLNGLDQLQLTIGDGDGTYAYNFTTTETLTAADGWQRVTVLGDTVGPDSIHIVLKDTKAGDAFSPVAITEMDNDLRPGYDNTGLSWRGWIGNMFLFNRELDAGELARVGSLDQSKARYSAATELPGKTFSALSLKDREWSHDWSGTGGRLWQDDGKVTPAATDGDPVHRSESVGNNLRCKEFVAPSTDTRPVWQANVVNFQGALYFDSLDLLSLDGYATLGQLSGDFTYLGALRPDTTTDRVFLSDGIHQYLQISPPVTVTGGQGRIHSGQVHLRMMGSEYGDYRSPYGGLTARVPRGEGDWFVFSLTRRDTLYELNVNNTYLSTATKGDAEGVGLWQIGGSGNNAFKGWVAEVHKYSRALSNRVRDSLVHAIAGKYGIPAPLRTDETFDEERIPLLVGTDPDFDYFSFGEPYVLPAQNTSGKDTLFYHLTCESDHNGRVEPLNPNNRSGTYALIYDENFQLVDSIRTLKDINADTLDARQGSIALFGRDSFLAAVAYAKYFPNDTVPGVSGFKEFRSGFRWVNWRTGAKGPWTEITHPDYPDRSDRFLCTGVATTSSVDTFRIPGYVTGAGDNYIATLIRTGDGGSSFTTTFNIDPAAGQFSYLGLDGAVHTPTGIEIRPEECKLLAMSNGEYIYTIRNDEDDPATPEDDRGFYTYISSDIDDWSSAVLRHGFTDGVSMPNITEIDRILYVSQRDDFRPGIGELKTFVWRSLDFGRTWEKMGQVDHERADSYGTEDMYGGVARLNGKVYVVKSSADRTLGGQSAELSAFPLDSLK